MEIVSPHDSEARLGHKPGNVEWVGYKDHQTETCDEEQPNLIVHVVTTPAPEQDIGVVGGIHAALAEQQLAPAEHFVDSGYVTPETVHHAATDHAITIVGPVRQDPRAEQRPGFAKEDFHIDWQAETVTCPQGIVSPPWKPTVADCKPRLSVLFRRADCRNWTVRQDCTGNVDGKGRHLLLLPSRYKKFRRRPEPSNRYPNGNSATPYCRLTPKITNSIGLCAGAKNFPADGQLLWPDTLPADGQLYGL
jgi:hypothetical protein